MAYSGGYTISILVGTMWRRNKLQIPYCCLSSCPYTQAVRMLSSPYQEALWRSSQTPFSVAKKMELKKTLVKIGNKQMQCSRTRLLARGKFFHYSPPTFLSIKINFAQKHNQNIDVAKIFDWGGGGGGKPQITCNNVRRNFSKELLWDKDILKWMTSSRGLVYQR